MKQVEIADLEPGLIEHLRNGETILVLDAQKPVAHIVPIASSSSLHVRIPASTAPPPNKVPLPKASRLELDVVQLLLEARQNHR